MVGHKLISLTSTIVPHFHTILACQQEVQTISHEDEEIWQLMLKRKAEMLVSFENILFRVIVMWAGLHLMILWCTRGESLGMCSENKFLGWGFV